MHIRIVILQKGVLMLIVGMEAVPKPVTVKQVTLKQLVQQGVNDFTVWELPQDAIARYGSGALCDLAVSADGMSLAAGTGIGVWWYDLTTCHPVSLFETERGMVGCIALCSGQPWLAVKNSDKEGEEVIKIWDLQRQQCIAVMEYEDLLKFIQAISIFRHQGNGLLQVAMVVLSSTSGNR